MLTPSHERLIPEQMLILIHDSTRLPCALYVVHCLVQHLVRGDALWSLTAPARGHINERVGWGRGAGGVGG